jgi:hypothetical protein
MRLTDEQIAQFKRDGFLLIENFLTEEERLTALDGFYKLYAPPYDEYVASGGKNETPQQMVFPWDHTGLNHVSTHPDIIDAAERIIGTRGIRLCESHLGMKYYEGKADQPAPDSVKFIKNDSTNGSELYKDIKKLASTPPGLFHVDWDGNSLGPFNYEVNSHLTFFYYFDDVKPGMAPIYMTPYGRPDSEAIPMVAPGGSLVIYSMFTSHAASDFVVPGHRPVEWVAFSRNDRLWDGGRYFTYKNGVKFDGMKRFIVEASPRQLELIGFPPLGDPAWTEEFIEGMASRYEGFNKEPYYKALKLSK